jgi:restriction system protein
LRVICGIGQIRPVYFVPDKGETMENMKVPQFFRYIIPIVHVLKELGGSGRAGEVTDGVIEYLNIPDNEVAKTTKSGQSRIKNQIQWARLLLVKTGYLDASERGVWSLSEKGFKANLTQEDLADLYKWRKKWGKEYRKTRAKKGKAPESSMGGEDSNDDESPSEISDFRDVLLRTLQSLPPEGFERICQRLLREAGFEQVTVTGKSGDGGIDGIGILQVNPFVSFRVLFQCKRYQGSVSASKIRDFRGAMMGRADKGIILTTGSFTSDSKKEANRDGVPPIQLVDGEKLMDMFVHLELGLVPVKTYEVDEKFFERYKDRT